MPDLEPEDLPFGDGPVLDVVPPRNLEALTRAELLSYTRSMISLNHRLVRGWNVSLRAHEEMNRTIGELLEETNLLEARSTEEEAAAEQASEESAAAGLPDSLRTIDPDVAGWIRQDAQADLDRLEQWPPS